MHTSHGITPPLSGAGYKKDVEMKKFLAQQKTDYKATKGLFKVVGFYCSGVIRTCSELSWWLSLLEHWS